MRPIDLRNDTWLDVQRHVRGDRRRVYAAWQKHGPCTTEELARVTGISILTLRPRTTELHQMGLVDLAGKTGTRGFYIAVGEAEAQYRFYEKQRALESQETQLTLFPLLNTIPIYAGLSAEALAKAEGAD